jgi:hypothetical protein
MKLDDLLKDVKLESRREIITKAFNKIENLERWTFVTPYEWVYWFNGTTILFWPVLYRFEYDGHSYRNTDVFKFIKRSESKPRLFWNDIVNRWDIDSLLSTVTADKIDIVNELNYRIKFTPYGEPVNRND